MQHEGYSQTLE